MSRLLFRPEIPVRIRSPQAAQYKPPFDPPAKHPRVLVDPAYLAQLRKDLTVGDNLPAWKAVKEIAVRPCVFRIRPDQELRFQGALVSALRQKAFYYLMTGDKTVGREAIDLAKKYMSLVSFGNGQDICRPIGESIYSTALVYDWCYPLLTDEDKKVLRDRIRIKTELHVGDKAVTVNGYAIALPQPLDKDFLMPVETAASLFDLTPEIEPASGTVMLTSNKEPSDLLLVTATDKPGVLADLIVKRRGAWVVHGRNTRAEIVFLAPKPLSGIEFRWQHGARRKQFTRVDVSPDGKVFSTVFDGASDGKTGSQTVTFPSREARAVRLYLKGNSSNTWNAMSAIRFLP